MTPPKKRLYKKEYAQELIRIARADLQSASVLAQAKNSGRPETAMKKGRCH